MIVIVDYGIGNISSIANMLKKVGAKAIIASDFDTIRKAQKLILPGVGAFDAGMKNLQERNLVPILNEMVFERKIPILGLCLGMQLMAKGSEEGQFEGLGWIDAKVVRFKFEGESSDLKIPHMGWNTLDLCREHPLVNQLGEDPRFYFVHSYHLMMNDPNDVLAKTQYGYDFASVIQRDNILGSQFHPEKSHKYGMALLHNFAEMQP